MPSQIIRCDAVRGVDRRSVLIGLAGVAGLAPAARAAPSAAALGDLVTGEGGASGLARSLAGTIVTLRGYLAPSLDGREFPMTDASAAPCQLCGNQHEAGRAILVRVAMLDVPVLERVEVTGRLEVDEAGGVRLIAAGIRAL